MHDRPGRGQKAEQANMGRMAHADAYQICVRGSIYQHRLPRLECWRRVPAEKSGIRLKNTEKGCSSCKILNRLDALLLALNFIRIGTLSANNGAHHALRWSARARSPLSSETPSRKRSTSCRTLFRSSCGSSVARWMYAVFMPTFAAARRS